MAFEVGNRGGPKVSLVLDNSDDFAKIIKKALDQVQFVINGREFLEGHFMAEHVQVNKCHWSLLISAILQKSSKSHWTKCNW